MKNKILIVFIIVILMSSMLTGCLTSQLDFDNRIVIQGIAVDFDMKQKKYKVTLQCYDLKKGGSGGSDSEGETTKIIVGKGDSIERAIDDTIQITGNNPILSQNRVIILSETVVANGIFTAIDTFTRNYKVRSTVPIAISKDYAAGDILKITEGDSKVTAETLKNILESEDINSYLKKTTVADVIRMKEEDTTSITIPALTIFMEDKDYYARLYGLAVFKEDKLYNYLDDKETRGVLAIVDELKQGSYVVQRTSQGIATFQILESKTKTKLRVNKDNSVSYGIELGITVDLMELDFKSEHSLSKKQIKELETKSNEYIEYVIENVFEKCLIEYNCDVFRIGRMLWLKYPNRYRELDGNWNEYLPKVKTSVDVKTTIRRIGRYTVTR